MQISCDSHPFLIDLMDNLGRNGAAAFGRLAERGTSALRKERQTMRGTHASRRAPQRADHFELLETRQLLSSTLQVGPTATYHTIQSAVNAAHKGDRIVVAPGTYVEQVVVPSTLSNLTISSKNGPSSTIIQAPATLTGSNAIITDQGNGLEVSGFTIEGPATGISAGVLVNGANNAEIDNNVIIHVHDVPASGAESGYGIEVMGGGNASISGDSISDYQKNGILVTGASSSASIWNVVVTGDGPTAVTVQNGIVFSNGAGGTVSSSVVSKNQTLLVAESGGILAFNSGQVFIYNNLVFNNDGDIILDGPSGGPKHPHHGRGPMDGGDDDNDGKGPMDGGDDNHGKGKQNGSVVEGNETYGATFDGIALFDGVTGANIVGNYSHDNGFDGLLIDGNSTGNQISFNVLVHNNRSNVTAFDLEDDTFGQSYPITGDGGTANFYKFNFFGTTNTNLKSA
jgi:hypothetical protein